MPHSTMPSSPADRQKLRSSIDTIVDSYTRMQGETDLINAEKKAIKENFDIDPKLLAALIKARRARNAPEVVALAEDFDLFHEALFESTNASP